MSPQYERLNRWIDDLQANRHPDVADASDPAELAMLATAEWLRGSRPGADAPDPAFLANLRAGVLAAAGLPATTGAGPLPPSATGPGALPAPTLSAALAPTPGPPPTGIWERRTTRRTLLSSFGGLAAGLVAGLGLEAWLSQSEVTSARAAAAASEAKLDELQEYAGTYNVPAGNIATEQGRWFAVAHLNDVPIGDAIPITMGGVKGQLLRTADREFTPLSGSCTHLGCDIAWDNSNHLFLCGCHGSSFDATGKPLTGPGLYTIPIRHLPMFSWKIENDTVYVLA